MAGACCRHWELEWGLGDFDRDWLRRNWNQLKGQTSSSCGCSGAWIDPSWTHSGSWCRRCWLSNPVEHVLHGVNMGNVQDVSSTKHWKLSNGICFSHRRLHCQQSQSQTQAHRHSHNVSCWTPQHLAHHTGASQAWAGEAWKHDDWSFQS